MTTTQMINSYKARIEALEQKINNLQRVSDKLIEAREITTLERVLKDLEGLTNECDQHQ